MTAGPHAAVGLIERYAAAFISGVPDHRDSVLTPAEQASNKTVMICCAGSKSEKLVLDL